MTAPRDGIGPERLGELVDGAPARDSDELDLLALMQDVREVEGPASPELRERVLAAAAAADEAAPAEGAARRGLRGLDPRRWLGDPAERRRRLFVAAPVTAAIVALLVAIPVITSGGGDGGSGGGDATSLVEPESAGAERDRGAAADSAVPAPAAAAPSAPEDADAGEAAPGITAQAPAPGAGNGRLQQVNVRTRVQVADVEALSKASGRAMTTVRRLGGYTASSDYGVPNRDEGTNELVFRVPVGRVDAALAAFADLGTVVHQYADIEDVTQKVARGDRAVTRLEERLATARAEAAADPTDAAKARAVVRAEAEVARAEAAVAAQRRAAQLATLELTLTTDSTTTSGSQEEGRFTGPIADAGDRLAGGLAWLLGALVLLAPFAILAVLAAWGVRRMRGRGQRRLMGSR